MFNSIINWGKGVLSKMGLIKTLKTVSDHKKIAADEGQMSRVERYEKMYQGYDPAIHDYNVTVGGYKKKRKKKTLSMPKHSTEYLASLIYNDKCDINVGDEESEERKYIEQVFDDSHFENRFNQKLEVMLALGGMAIRPFVKNGKVQIGFADAKSFIPIGSDTEEVTEGVFITSFNRDGKYYTLLEWHEWERSDLYVVTNELYQSSNKDELGVRVSLKTIYQELEERYEYTQLTRSLFVYIKPNIVNNRDLKSPLGISIYDNAVDTLDFIDTTFTSYYREIVLGGKRVIVNEGLLKVDVDPITGETKSKFDTDDEVFKPVKMNEDSPAVTDISVPIRAKEHIDTINTALSLLAFQLGLNPGTFTFDGRDIKTATEVVSEKSETFKTKQKHAILVGEGLKSLIISILELAKSFDFITVSAPDEVQVEINFDDSIAQDEDTLINRYTSAKNNGMMPIRVAIQRAFNLTDDEAMKWAAEIQEEERANAADPTEFIGAIGRGDD